MTIRVSDQKYPFASVPLQTISNTAFTQPTYQRLLYTRAHRKIMQVECVRTDEDSMEIKMDTAQRKKKA
jgi:hypothetical protein